MKRPGGLVAITLLLLVFALVEVRVAVAQAQRKTVTYTDGGRYQGEIHNGKRHGRGTYFYPDGSRYVGDWRDGLKHGQGTYVWPDGGRHVGQWRSDKRHGQGTRTWPNGHRYEGQWHSDRMYGQGTYTWPDGSRYVGQWRNAKKHGTGAYSWPNGHRYEGEWRNDKMYGQGTYTWPDGSRYVGFLRDDKKHGRGTRTWPDGRRYEGEWFGDRMHGRGTMTHADGRRYEGQWRTDKMYGQGTYTWRDGGRYVGEWRDDMKHGRGTRAWPNGRRYEGEWFGDKMHGRGTLIRADGSRYEGEWRDGKRIDRPARERQRQVQQNAQARNAEERDQGRRNPLDPKSEERGLGLTQTMRKQIQSCLKVQGFDPGPSDGVFGPRTRKAIRTWQAARGQEQEAGGYLAEGSLDALMAGCRVAENRDTETQGQSQRQAQERESQEPQREATATPESGQANDYWRNLEHRRQQERPGAVNTQQESQDQRQVRQQARSRRQTESVNRPLCTERNKEADALSACWQETVNQPGCHVWNSRPQPGETVSWSGGCVDGKASGAGKTVWRWRDEGEWKTSSGEGEKRDGRSHGHWVFRRSDGVGYEGPYVNGVRHGHWVFRYADGDVLEGPYVNGERHGRFVWRGTDGDAWNCWENGEKTGRSMCYGISQKDSSQTAGRVDLRSGPGEDYEAIGELEFEEWAHVNNAIGDWLWVHASFGRQGFVHRSALSLFAGLESESRSPGQQVNSIELLYWLKRAESAENRAKILELLDNGANPNVVDEHRNTPLHYAALQTHTKGVLLALIRRGARCNAKNSIGETPLHFAANVTRPPVEDFPKLLTECGADPNARGQSGFTPLHNAFQPLFYEDTYFQWQPHIIMETRFRAQSKETISRLLRYGSDPNIEDDDGNVPLIWALHGNKAEEIINLLLQTGADPNARGRLENTPLHYMVEDSNLTAVKALLQHGADPNATIGYPSSTPLHMAAERSRLDIVKTLLDHGADPNAQDQRGRTLLHHAGRYRPEAKDLVRLLIAGGADPCIEDHRGRTPHDFASRGSQAYMPRCARAPAQPTAMRDSRRRQAEVAAPSDLEQPPPRGTCDGIKTAYKHALDRLGDQYRMAHRQCGELTGRAMRCCRGKAYIARERGEARLKEATAGTLDAACPPTDRFANSLRQQAKQHVINASFQVNACR